MARSILQRAVLPGVLIAAGFALVIVLTGVLERSRPSLPDGLADTDLHLHGSRLKGFAFGMEGLAADWYYMRSLQYIGGKLLDRKDDTINIDDLRELNPRLLYPLLDNATDLDPHFIAAYNYGAVILPAIDAEKAIALASKGIANNPNEWRLYQQLGYVYWRLGRYAEAADTYEKGSAVSGASPIMKMMAANMKNDGGSRPTFRAVYQDMLANSTDEQVIEMAGRRLREIASLDQREAIDTVLGDFKAANNRCANGLSEIAPMLMSVTMPGGSEFRVDSANRPVGPTGVPYLLDKENCRVMLDGERTGSPLK